MFCRKILFALLLLAFFQTALAQTTEKEKPKAVTEELRKDAVAFLRETNAEVTTLRSLENRIGFSSEMAGLMWFYDEKEAVVMYQSVINDFKLLLADYDAQMNAMNLTPNESEYRSSIFGGNQDDKTRLTQKFYKAIGVRQQISMSLAEHDAALAFNFYYETLGIISNAELRKTIGQRDAYFELQLIKQIAAKDPAKALEFGRKSIANGIGWAHVDLLKQIYEKNAAKGAEFADAIVRKYKDDRVSASNFANVASFLNMGAENSEKIKKEAGKKPMFTEQQLRDLAEILAQEMLQRKETDNLSSGNYLDSYLGLIEKYAPARAIQMRAKFPNKIKSKQPAAVFGQADLPMSTIRTAPVLEPKAEVENKAQQEEAMKNVLKLNSKELPKEERDKIIAQARKIINGMGNKQEKILALGMLASQVAAAGDKELAGEIMKDAQTLVNPSPKNYNDFIEVWLLASAFAVTDADKAFPILEDAVSRLNDTISAFIKVGEFMDVSGEIIDDGEVQVGTFGGPMMTGLTRELGIATSTIRSLAIADFGKTKALTNKFDRTEVRILAKMLVLRAVLGDETKKLNSEAITVETEDF